MIVEDDASLSEWIADYLIEEGYEITLCNRGDEAVYLIQSDNPDLVLLDINLPVMDGFSICREVRLNYNKPILMMTARDNEMDEVLGLEIGANDYIVKPIRPRALLARIKSLLRNDLCLVEESPKVLSFGQFLIDYPSRTTYLYDEIIPISSNEFELLWLLASRAGEIISRGQLVEELRGIKYDGFDRSVDILISRLRKKLDDNASSSRRIKTVWGKGYTFVANAWGSDCKKIDQSNLE